MPHGQLGDPPLRLMLLWAVLSHLHRLEGERAAIHEFIYGKKWSSQICSAVLSTSASNLQLLYNPFLFVPGNLLSHYYRTFILALKTFLPVHLLYPKNSPNICHTHSKPHDFNPRPQSAPTHQYIETSLAHRTHMISNHFAPFFQGPPWHSVNPRQIRPTVPSKQNTSIAHQSTNRQDFSNKTTYTQTHIHANPSRTTEVPFSHQSYKVAIYLKPDIPKHQGCEKTDHILSANACSWLSIMKFYAVRFHLSKIPIPVYPVLFSSLPEYELTNQ